MISNNFLPSLCNKVVLISLLFANVFAQSPKWEWAFHGETGKSKLTLQIFVDTDSSIYASTSFLDYLNLGNYSFQTQKAWVGDEDLVLWKMNTKGDILWAKQFGTSATEQAIDIGRDLRGKLYVEILIDGQQHNLPNDSIPQGEYRQYFDETGDWEPIKRFSFPEDTDPLGRQLWLKNLPYGDTVVYGKDTLIGGGGSGAIYQDYYIGLSDITGRKIFGSLIGNTSNQAPSVTRILSPNKIFVAGRIGERETIICGDTLEGVEEGIFWAYYDTLGNCLDYNYWEMIEPGIEKILVGRQQEVFLLVPFWDTLSFNGRPLGSVEERHRMILKIDSVGEIAWVNATSTDVHFGNFNPSKLVLDQYDNLLLSGSSFGKVKFDQLVFGKDSANDLFIIAFNQEGKAIWVIDSDMEKSSIYNLYFVAGMRDIALGQNDKIYALGTYYQTFPYYDTLQQFKLGLYNLPVNGFYNFFIASLTKEFTKSLSPSQMIQCPLYINYQQNHLLLQDICSELAITQFNLFSIAGQKITISEREKLTQGYLLQPAQSLPPGIYIFQWERRNGERGVKKFIVGTN